MNQSEIAERAAREIRRHFDEDFDTTIPSEVFDRDLVLIVERAIAESQAWISVKEKLPEIVRHWGGLDEKMYGSSVEIMIWDGSDIEVGYYYGSGRWDNLSGDGLTDVTHWRTLPEPPKGNENV